MPKPHIMFGLALLLATTAAHARYEVTSMGENGGIRLLLHVTEADLPPGSEPVVNPCDCLPPIVYVDDVLVEYDGPADTLMVWVYLYHPREFAVSGVGFGILYEGVDVVTSGCCAPRVYQDPNSMGTWADSGSEIAYAWTPDDYPRGWLEPVGWFVLARLARDGFFEVYSGETPMAGAVGDDNRPPRPDAIWNYGRVGFGSVAGDLPVPDPRTIPGSSGAAAVSAQ